MKNTRFKETCMDPSSSYIFWNKHHNYLAQETYFLFKLVQKSGRF